MKLAISDVTPEGFTGLLKLDDGELRKVRVWSGSATTPWRAVIQTAAWVDLSVGTALDLALTQAVKDYNLGVVMHKIDQLIKLIKEGDQCSNNAPDVEV
jgi:hypothetical protein